MSHPSYFYTQDHLFIIHKIGTEKNQDERLLCKNISLVLSHVEDFHKNPRRPQTFPEDSISNM